MNAKLLQHSDEAQIGFTTGNHFKYHQTSLYTMYVPSIQWHDGYYVDFQLTINKYNVLLLTHSLTHFKFHSLINVKGQIKLLNKLCFLEQFSERTIDDNQIRFLHFMKKTSQNQFIAAQESGQIYLWTQNKEQNWIATKIENEEEIYMFYLVSDENLIILANGDHYKISLIERNSNNVWKQVEVMHQLQPKKVNIGMYCEFIFKAFYEGYECKEFEFITENIYVITSKGEIAISKSKSLSDQPQKLSNLSINEFIKEKILLDINKKRNFYVLKLKSSTYFFYYDFDGYVKIYEYEILQNVDDKKFAQTNDGEVAVTFTSHDFRSIQLKFLRLRY